LFFSWYIKNKHFKQKSNLSGQILPFLLVVIVILLIAAISVIQIGKVAIDKTCTANGADAGSLAAASRWATALNNLAYSNFYLTQNYGNYNELSNELISMADYYVTQSRNYAQAAATNAILSSVSMIISLAIPEACFDMIADWVTFGYLYTASSFSSEAMKTMSAAKIYIDFIDTLTTNFYLDQQYRYCQIRTVMANAYVAAEKEGFRYAFSNSCIPSKLSNREIDTFNNWLANDGFYQSAPHALWRGLVGGAPAGFKRSQYVWIDNSQQRHIVSVDLRLPDIESYELIPTVANYAQIHLNNLERSQLAGKIIDGLNLQYQALGFIWPLALGVAITATIACAIIWLFGAGEILNLGKKALQFVQAVSIGGVIAAFGIAIGVGIGVGAAAGTIGANYRLLLENEASTEPWAESPNTYTSTTCPESILDLTAVNPDANMIVSIGNIKLENNSWTATCCTSQIHPKIDITTGTIISNPAPVKSCSTSKFSGGTIDIQYNASPPSTTDPSPDELEDFIGNVTNADYAPEIVNITIK
jgi:hypothetical protein